VSDGHFGGEGGLLVKTSYTENGNATLVGERGDLRTRTTIMATPRHLVYLDAIYEKEASHAAVLESIFDTGITDAITHRTHEQATHSVGQRGGGGRDTGG